MEKRKELFHFWIKIRKWTDWLIDWWIWMNKKNVPDMMGEKFLDSIQMKKVHVPTDRQEDRTGLWRRLMRGHTRTLLRLRDKVAGVEGAGDDKLQQDTGIDIFHRLGPVGGGDAAFPPIRGLVDLVEALLRDTTPEIVHEDGSLVDAGAVEGVCGAPVAFLTVFVREHAEFLRLPLLEGAQDRLHAKEEAYGSVYWAHSVSIYNNLLHQSINQSINQSTKKSINQLIDRLNRTQTQ